jgi:hypothetical protein
MTPYDLRALAHRFMDDCAVNADGSIHVPSYLRLEVFEFFDEIEEQRGIPLSLLLRYAAMHGGVYSVKIPSRWPWGAPTARVLPRYSEEVLKTGDGVNCSTLTAAVLRACVRDVHGEEQVAAAYFHSYWMIHDGRVPWSVLGAARVLCGSKDDKGVRLCQGWRGLDANGHVQKGSGGHTWIEVDTYSGVRIIDATPTVPWRGVRMMAPVPTSWRWDEVRSVALDVDVNR